MIKRRKAIRNFPFWTS